MFSPICMEALVRSGLIRHFNAFPIFLLRFCGLGGGGGSRWHGDPPDFFNSQTTKRFFLQVELSFSVVQSTSLNTYL